MCGIAGFFGKKRFTTSEVDSVFDTLKHRGPDGYQKIEFPIGESSYLNLFFSRLSILDLKERAMQPMKYERYTILMNGEIYNYKKLKRVIEQEKGPQEWITSGDTEVALRYIASFGVESIKDFDGMFAIALWDEENKKLKLMRDFFGEKPLFYFKDNNGLCFASEPKTISALTSSKSTLNQNKVTNFIANGYKCIYKNRDNFFLGIEEVLPGEIIVFSESDFDNPFRHVYKSLPLEFPNLHESRSQVISRIRNCIIESVGLRLESDVPIALCLSGGVDSGLIAAIAQKEFGISLRAFTIASKDARYSEEINAAKVAKFLDLEHTIVKVNGSNFLNNMKQIIKFHDAPVATISYYIQNFLMRRIHDEGFKVSLMGSGADELFSGYYDHHLLYLAEMRQRHDADYENSLKEWEENILPLVRNPVFRSPNLYSEQPDYREHIYEGSKVAGELIKSGMAENFHERHFSLSLMRNRMLNELFNEVIPVILKEDDRNSMMFSVENRSPYLSYEVLTESMKTDVKFFIDKARTKVILREAFSGYLPEDILNSYRKVGFNASFPEICDIGGEEFQEFLNDDSPFWEFMYRDKVKMVFSSLEDKDYMNKLAFNIVSAKIFVDTFTARV